MGKNTVQTEQPAFMTLGLWNKDAQDMSDESACEVHWDDEQSPSHEAHRSLLQQTEMYRKVNFSMRNWDPGILSYAAANTYEISSSFLFVQNSCMLLVPLLRIPVHETSLRNRFVHIHGNEKDSAGLDFSSIEQSIYAGNMPYDGQILKFELHTVKYYECPACSFAIAKSTNSFTSRFLFENYLLIVNEYLVSKRFRQVLSDASDEIHCVAALTVLSDSSGDCVGATELGDEGKDQAGSEKSDFYTILPWIGGVARLVLILGLEDVSATKKAARAIGDALVNEHMRTSFKEAGDVKPLLQLLKHSDTSVRAVAHALEKPSVSSIVCQKIKAEGGLELFVDSVQNPNTAVEQLEKIIYVLSLVLDMEISMPAKPDSCGRTENETLTDGDRITQDDIDSGDSGIFHMTSEKNVDFDAISRLIKVLMAALPKQKSVLYWNI